MTLRRLAHLLPLAFLVAAHAQHAGDIAVTRTGSTLVTNAYDPALALTPERMFLATLGDTGVPRFTSNPGFEAAAGTFAAGSRLGWNAVSGLQRWNGSAFEPAVGMELELKYLTLRSTVAAAPVEGFSLAVQSNGGIHRHLGFTLRDAFGSGPSTGAYLLSLQLYATGSTGVSDTLWILFNDGIDTAAFDAIAQAAREVLLPDPCPGDVDRSGAVDAGDIGAILLMFGTADPAGDIDSSSAVDAGDIGAILLMFGPCP
jgi:hypothetical protein